MRQENFPIKYEGEDYWFSRSLACAVIVFAYDKNGKIHVLANKRGPGAEFNKGKWNIPGGFIDFGETAEQCACREAKEETGIELKPSQLHFFNLNTDPVGVRQTMTVRYVVELKPTSEKNLIENIYLTDRYSELGEVAKIEWIPVETCQEAEALNEREWTRDQVKYIHQALEFLLSDRYMSEPW